MSLQNTGLVKQSRNSAAVTKIDIPKLRDGYMLVKTMAVALNPADWQDLDERGAEGCLMGCDFAGIVQEVAKNVKKNFNKGDRVFGVAHGTNRDHPEYGTFAEYIVVKGDCQMHIPPKMTFEDAATLGCGVTTVGLGLYSNLGLPPPGLPSENPLSILIYGGSSATGTLAIQFAKLSGLTVVTTCSPHNHEMVKRLGADAVFDYRDVDCANKIREYTHDTLRYVFDTIGTESSASICADSISSQQGGTYCSLLPVDCPRQDVKSIFFLGYTILGETFVFENEVWPANQSDFDFGVKFYEQVERLLVEDRLIPHKASVRQGGLGGIMGGLEEMKDGRISGEKLVYRIE